MRQVEHHEGRGAADLLGHLLEGLGGNVVVAVERRRGGEQRQAFRAAGHHPVHQHRVEAVGLAQRVGDALQRVLVEVEPGGPERQVEVDQHRAGLQPLGDRMGDIVSQGRDPRPALGAAESDLATDERRRGIGVEAGGGADQQQRVERRDQILRHPAAHQLAIEGDVVGRTDDHHLGARVADLGQAVELSQQHRGRVGALDHHQRGRGLVLIGLDGGGQAAHAHDDDATLHAPVGGGDLGELSGLGAGAVDVDGDPRQAGLAEGRLGPGQHVMHRIGRGRPLRRQRRHGGFVEVVLGGGLEPGLGAGALADRRQVGEGVGERIGGGGFGGGGRFWPRGLGRRGELVVGVEIEIEGIGALLRFHYLTTCDTAPFA